MNDYLAAPERSLRKVKEFIDNIIHAEPERAEPQRTPSGYRDEVR